MLGGYVCSLIYVWNKSLMIFGLSTEQVVLHSKAAQRSIYVLFRHLSSVLHV